MTVEAQIGGVDGDALFLLFLQNLYLLLFLQPPLLPSLCALYKLCQTHFMNFIYWSFCLF
jgi:hypothetical protein